MADKNEAVVSKGGKRGKQNGYSSKTLWAKHDKRRAQAEARDDRHASLSIQEKIKKAKSRRGGSKRELARLETRLAESKKPAVVVAPVVDTVVKTVKKVSKK